MNGVSFGHDAREWSGEYDKKDDICFVIDRSRLPNAAYDINGTRVMNLTRAILAEPEHTDDYLAQFGASVLEKPDEVFVVGNIINLPRVLVRIIVQTNSRGTAPRSWALGYKDDHGIRVSTVSGFDVD